MSDYYNILGVSRDASLDDIKNAYKKLARVNHPDKGGDKDRFQKIQEAYEILSDKNKRDQYDNPSGIGGGMDDMFPFGFDHPFFKNNRRHQQQVRKGDHMYTCKISLRDVYFGIVKKLRIQRTRVCKTCMVNCTRCGGNGVVSQHMQMGPFTQVIQQTCPYCNGSGKTNDKSKKCESCNGKGSIREDRLFEIDIKRGVESGKRFIFEEWGEQAVKENEVSGAFVVVIEIEPNEHFKRISSNGGLDLEYEIKLTYKESVVGKTVIIPHFAGDINLDTRGFGLINPKKDYIVYNRGLIGENGKQGNMVIKFFIDYPERTFDDYDVHLLTDTFDKVGLQ
jgi:DnaJ family protein A protein 2